MKKVRQAVNAMMLFLLCTTLLCSTALADTGEYTGIFPDVPVDAEYAEAVETLHELGIFAGDSNGNFNPDSTITRAEASTVICRLMGVETEAKAMKNVVFTDVPTSHWAVGYVAKASELGIISGYGNGKFGPSDPVTQEQMVKMLVCAWGYERDAIKNCGWPSGYVVTAEELGIIETADGISNSVAPRSLVAEWCYNILYIDCFVEG